MTTATIDAIADRINADPAHAELVAGAIAAMTAAAATSSAAPDEQAQDAALVGLVWTGSWPPTARTPASRPGATPWRW